ncbi:MAG: hypothetical protein WCK78_03240 [Paludibacter sp.]
MEKETVELISAWVTIIGLPIALVTILVAFRQFRYSKKISEAKLWLELRQSFLVHNEVHLKLRNGGDWAIKKSKPTTVEDWAKIDAYLGQFELCHLMLEKCLIESDMFKSQYDFRLYNILHNAEIVEYINHDATDWEKFIKLCRSFGYNQI